LVCENVRKATHKILYSFLTLFSYTDAAHTFWVYRPTILYVHNKSDINRSNYADAKNTFSARIIKCLAMRKPASESRMCSVPTRILKHQNIFIQMAIVLGPPKMKNNPSSKTNSGQISPVHIKVVIWFGGSFIIFSWHHCFSPWHSITPLLHYMCAIIYV